ncbi:ABC transporter permease [Streptomyces sp. AJS327]|uniref:ABC-2 transporter permease n=1 Tax=Streptomyces sp. AJS327 TaxID=2545265 RepID=UPI0015DF7D1A|nr:ABC transporter permease [Streptomyces sp. AJS327]MBA0052740.1 ABC transporter permease [Streptomyces sp. AJS327]
MASEPSVGEPARTRGGDGVIHDIGYRHYDGPRLGRGYARLSLFTQSLRGAYGLGRSAKSKALPMVLFVVVCMPAAIVVAVAVATGGDELAVGYSEYTLQLQPVTGIFIAAMAPQAVSLDLRFKTVPLYFSRPIERQDYVLAKYAALAAAIFVFTAAPVLVLYVGALLGELGFADQTGKFAGGLVLCALFSLLHAGIGLTIAAVTPRRGFGVAAIIAVLTVPYFLVSALQEIAVEQEQRGLTGWIGLGSPGSLLDGIQGAYLGGITLFPGGRELAGVEGLAYLLCIVALIGGTYLLLLRRYRKAGL